MPLLCSSKHSICGGDLLLWGCRGLFQEIISSPGGLGIIPRVFAAASVSQEMS